MNFDSKDFNKRCEDLKKFFEDMNKIFKGPNAGDKETSSDEQPAFDFKKGQNE